MLETRLWSVCEACDRADFEITEYLTSDGIRHYRLGCSKSDTCYWINGDEALVLSVADEALEGKRESKGKDMLESIFNSKDNDNKDSLGWVITAKYDDAIKFASNFCKDSVKGAIDGEAEHPMITLIELKGAAEKVATVISTIAFVYGKADAEVRRDLEMAQKEHS